MILKQKKTLKLHWKEANVEYYTPSGRVTDTIWSKISTELGPVKVDSEKLEQLFVSKTVELKNKVSWRSYVCSLNKFNEIIKKKSFYRSFSYVRYRLPQLWPSTKTIEKITNLLII